MPAVFTARRPPPAATWRSLCLPLFAWGNEHKLLRLHGYPGHYWLTCVRLRAHALC